MDLKLVVPNLRVMTCTRCNKIHLVLHKLYTPLVTRGSQIERPSSSRSGGPHGTIVVHWKRRDFTSLWFVLNGHNQIKKVGKHSSKQSHTDYSVWSRCLSGTTVSEALLYFPTSFDVDVRTQLLIRALSRAFRLHSRQIKSLAAHTAPKGPFMKGTSQRATSTEAAGQMLLKVPTLNLLLLPAASNSQTCFRGPFQNYEQRKLYLIKHWR